MTYGFRPATRDDLPRLRRWLLTPEVVRWWGDPATEAATLEGDLDDPRMAMRIVSHAGRPFAYAQHYDVQAWPQPHLAGLPPGTRAIDAFIGVPAMLGRGHGSGLLRQLAQSLLQAGAPLVVIDPDPANLRARAAYRRAGFVGEALVAAEGGDAVLMRFSAR